MNTMNTIKKDKNISKSESTSETNTDTKLKAETENTSGTKSPAKAEKKESKNPGEHSLGEALRKLRRRHGITLEEISVKTNISVKTLGLLESEEIAKISGQFYFKNYVGSYLRAIGEDESGFLGDYAKYMDSLYSKTHEPQLPYYSKLKYSRFKKKNLFLSLFLTALIFAGTVYVLVSKKDDIFGGWSSNSNEITVPCAGIDFTRLESHNKFSLDYTPVALSMEFTDKCWVQIIRNKSKSSGKQYKKGEKVNLEGYEFAIYMGKPSAVNMVVNGKPVTYLKSLAKPETVRVSPGALAKLFEK
ncbi:MAG: DUF4115 domain-containing protein [bacterium]|nr:DUF4115 domain-containing protein [bacterium]